MEDVNANTFQAFVQFGYTGDYSVPVMIFQEPEEQDTDSIAKDEVHVAEDEFDWGFSTSTKARKRQKAKESLLPFECRSYKLIEPRSRFATSYDPRLERGSRGNINEILLIHASLHVLADKWAVEGMKRLSLFKLHRSLALLELNVGIVPDIVGLVRYVYTDENPTLNELRDLLCHSILANASVMYENATFRDLFEEGGAFALDSWKYSVFPQC